VRLGSTALSQHLRALFVRLGRLLWPQVQVALHQLVPFNALLVAWASTPLNRR